MTEDEMYELAEAICEGERPWEDATLLMSTVTDADLITVDLFDGDYEETAVLSDELVRARKPYICHVTRRLIAVGERHRCLRERLEDGTIGTYRFCIGALVLMHFGTDPTVSEPVAAV